MDKPFYEFTILDEANRYEFTSIGHKSIDKVIIFQKTDLPNFYNLVLADIVGDGTYDDLIESNNGDMEKIMATVIQAIFAFLAFYPNANVLFSGSTPSRTRLYNIILTKEFEKLNDFTVNGLKDGKLISFVRNEKYDGFVIYKKK